MDFEFSEEQEMLRASVRAFLADKAPTSYVRQVFADDYRSEHYWDDEVATGLAQLGVTTLLLPEPLGGAGMGMVDAAVVLEELGRAVSPTPYTSWAIGALPILVEAGAPDVGTQSLASMLDGDGFATVAIWDDGNRYEWRTPTTVAHAPADGSWRVTGTKVHVLDGEAASLYVVSALDDNRQLGLYAIERHHVLPRDSQSVDLTRREFRVEFHDAPAVRLDLTDAVDTLGRTLDRLGVAAVVDGVGAAQRAMELAVEYAKERVQFDQPIGAFQAIQHLCADMLRTVELGRAAGYYACWALDNADPVEAHRAATLARAFAADAFPQLGGTAIQVFGGIGFTWEHDVHLYYKRLLTQSVALGSAPDHLEELASLAID